SWRDVSPGPGPMVTPQPIRSMGLRCGPGSNVRDAGPRSHLSLRRGTTVALRNSMRATTLLAVALLAPLAVVRTAGAQDRVALSGVALPFDSLRFSEPGSKL